MRFFILFVTEVLLVKNYCYTGTVLPLSRIKRSNKKDNEDIKNDTIHVYEKHISEFTNPQTGQNPYIDVIEAEPTDNNRNFNVLEAFDVSKEQPDEGEHNVVNGRSRMINRIEEKLLMDDYNVETEGDSRNSSLVARNLSDYTKSALSTEGSVLFSTTGVNVVTPTTYIYVNVTTSLVNSLSSPSIETYLIAATSIIFLMAAIIVVFGVWKWRWLGRQQRVNNDKRNTHQNHV